MVSPLQLNPCRFLTFHGREKAPSISLEKPQFTPGRKYNMPVAIVEIEDKDILKFITGGLHGLQALNENRIKIAGDVALAMSLEEGEHLRLTTVFIKTGGIDKVKAFFAKAKTLTKSKL
jgi:hypothetical protein